MGKNKGPEVVLVNADGTAQGSDEEAAARGSRGRVVDERPRREFSDDLIAEAAEYIDQEFIDDGGDYREDQFGTVYWLDLDHLLEFEKADQSIDSDKEFWKWFREYRSDHKIAGEKSRTTWKPFGDHKYEDSDRGNYLTSWWSGWGYSSASEKNQKLAIALGAVSSIVDVINNTGKRFRIELASTDNREAPQSFTAFEEQLVVVSPQALLDNSVKQDDGIEITAGWGLHEGSHIRWTTKIISALTQPEVLRPLVVAGRLFNIVEDLRIETKTSEEFPGFAGYFEKANAYLWDVTKSYAPLDFGPTLSDKLNLVTASVKWGTEYGLLLAEKSSTPKAKEEYAWFRAWADRYIDQKISPRAAIIEALRHLGDDPETKQQMDELSAMERQQEMGTNPGHLGEKEFRDLMDRLKQGLQAKDGKRQIEPCPSPGTGKMGQRIELTPEQSKEINQLIQQEFEKNQASNIQGAQSDADFTVSMRPVETPASRSAYKKPSSMVSRLKSAFVFRKITPEWHDRMLRSGDLDEDALWKITGNDLRVFQRKVTTEIPETQVTMLVDISSSMRSGAGGGGNLFGYGSRGTPKVDVAQELASTMLECLSTMRGVRVRVRAHHMSNNGPTVYKIWDRGDPRTRLGLINTLCNGGTPDGLALDWACKEMLSQRKPGEDMVVIMLSDGQPNVAPSGISGEEHVKKVCEHFAKQGISVVSIGLDASVRNSGGMYRHFVQYENEQKLPIELTRVLIKLFGGASQ